MLFTKKIKIISAVLICVLAVACKKKATPVQDNGVPYVPINVVIYPNDPLNFKIQTPGGWMYFSGGAGGLIVYRKSTTEFTVLDRTSTYLPDDFNARVKVQSDAFSCKDTISGSKWQIVDGAIMNGPATLPLRLYNNTYDGNALRITN
ncbi:MAG: hypothetical protein KA163_09380 [Bacteroidia bacterium]|nr:hypothetical protein [Bacteroidia bacterium]